MIPRLGALTLALPLVCVAYPAWPQESTLEPPAMQYFLGKGSWGQDYSDQWALQRIGFNSNPDSAWRLVKRDAAPVVVAVIDTGLDWNHRNIDGSNLWRNPNEIPNNGIDDDHNGYVDDVIGWDFFDHDNRPWDYDGHGTLVAGIIAGSWNDKGGMAGVSPFARLMVVKAINRAYERPETRPFWKVRLLSTFLVVLTGLITAGLFLLIVFGGPIGEAIADHAHLGSAFDLLWALLRWPIAFVAILLFFGVGYYLAPDQEQRDWKWLSPGALVAAILWLVLSALFALYTAFAGSYDQTYGSLAGAIILLLWLNYSAFALLFGAELNAELDRQADIHAAGGPQAGLVRPARRES